MHSFMRAADVGLLRICAYPQYWGRYSPRAAPVYGYSGPQIPGSPLIYKYWRTSPLPSLNHRPPTRPPLHHWSRGAPQRLYHTGAAVSHALGALTAVVGIGVGGDVFEPLGMGSAIESGFLAGGPWDWLLIDGHDAPRPRLSHLTTCSLGGTI
ncbi:hypothetical protein B0H15DRAFT_953051 [Mycena belliarum]|uniref:Uncharacterized protein n=1 Tax=Mycena belliarum TaxID=1033014 RepID=A0AAD6U1A3_9AGAR|nr:hypothetical protein B0H15DRAFT_953051 [Mycena belliae]